jgi:hypothetical protein
MKLSQNTISLLQSFSSINSNLLVKPGNKLVTRSTTGSTHARAEIDEVFPVEFAIYDLNQLLGLLNVCNDPDIEFGDKSMVIKSSNGGEVEYFYADSSIVVAPKDSELDIDPLFTFTMQASDISVIQKTSNFVSATTLSVNSKNGKAGLKINDPKNPTSNSYKKDLGQTDKDFDMKISMDSFRAVVPDSYEVQVAVATGRTGVKVAVFFLSSTTRKLTYLIAADPSSKY